MKDSITRVFTSKGFGNEGKTIKNPPINPLYNRKDKEIVKIKKLIKIEKNYIKNIPENEISKGTFTRHRFI